MVRRATEDVHCIVREVVAESRERNPRLVMPPAVSPDPDEVLRIRCPGCDRIRARPRRVIERDTANQGFWACSPKCKRAQDAKGEPGFAPMRYANRKGW